VNTPSGTGRARSALSFVKLTFTCTKLTTGDPRGKRGGERCYRFPGLEGYLLLGGGGSTYEKQRRKGGAEKRKASARQRRCVINATEWDDLLEGERESMKGKCRQKRVLLVKSAVSRLGKRLDPEGGDPALA